MSDGLAAGMLVAVLVACGTWLALTVIGKIIDWTSRDRGPSTVCHRHIDALVDDPDCQCGHRLDQHYPAGAYDCAVCRCPGFSERPIHERID